jgi:hypothetical protein
VTMATARPLSGSWHYYECGNGHYQSAPFELSKCQAMVSGKPCPGELAKVRRGGKAKA